MPKKKKLESNIDEAVVGPGIWLVEYGSSSQAVVILPDDQSKDGEMFLYWWNRILMTPSWDNDLKYIEIDRFFKKVYSNAGEGREIVMPGSRKEVKLVKDVTEEYLSDPDSVLDLIAHDWIIAELLESRPDVQVPRELVAVLMKSEDRSVREAIIGLLPKLSSRWRDGAGVDMIHIQASNPQPLDMQEPGKGDGAGVKSIKARRMQ